MKDIHLSRRRFTLLAGSAGAASFAIAAVEPLTAESIVKRIESALGGEAAANSVDGFKAGDSATRVKGIATTALASLTVLKQAVKSGANLVITYEPTFFGRADGPATPRPGANGGPPRNAYFGLSPNDPVYQAKKAFIEKNGLVIFRLRDRWQANRSDDMVTGLAESLGWSKYRVKPDDVLYDVPASTAEETVALIRSKLHMRGGLRAVGDRKARVRRVMLQPGFMNTATMWKRFGDADLTIAGEVREWENTHYAADIYTAGEKHGLVTIGRVVSEDPGMRVCSAWLKKTVKEVPAHWISAGDPYWRAV